MACNRPKPQIMLGIIQTLVLSSILLFGLLPTASRAQITTAITPDGTLGTAVTQRGTVYDITGGARPGNGPNLFHSFDRLSVGTHDTARFSGPTGIENIVSRVTGGQQSVIDGRLQSTIPGANLYLLNPSGVLFGPHATLDISGSFHVSTADFLRFADGATFSAHLSEKTTLTVAPPVAFGFLSEQPAPISIQGSTLQVSEGKALSVVGGEFLMVGGTLQAPSGRIQLASVASPGEVIPSLREQGPDLEVDAFARLGQIALSQRALIDVSGDGGGLVLVRGGQLLVDNAGIFADNGGDLHSTGLGLDLRIAAEAVITNGARITAEVFGSGNGGHIMVNVGTLMLSGGGQIGSSTRDLGRAGNVVISARDVISITGRDREGNPSGLFSNTSSGRDAGRLFISAPTLSMDDGLLQVLTASTGNAGDIAVSVGRLTLTGGAQIDSSTRGLGHGGALTVVATEMLAITGRDSEGKPSGLFSNTSGRAPGGTLALQARQIELSNGGTISASSSGAGDAGDILIQAGQTFRSQHGAVTTAAEQADGGNIQLTAGSLVDLRDSQMTATVKSGVGKGGNITIDPQSVVLNRSQIRADAFGGPGGNVRIEAGVFLADPSSQVSASSTLGIAGTVDIRAPVTSLSGAVAPLTQSFARAMELLRNRCAERLREGAVSRFVLGGRDGVPSEPGSVLPSPLVLRDQEMLTSHGQTPPEMQSARVGVSRMDKADQGQVQGQYVQALWPGALDVECAGWRRPHSTRP